MRSITKQVCLLVLVFFCAHCYSQADSSRFRMLQALTTYIKSNYVSADLAEQMCDTINWKFTMGKYDSTLNPDEFAFELTKDLRRISNDRHIFVTPPQWRTLQVMNHNGDYNWLTERQKVKVIKTVQMQWKKFIKKYKKRTKEDMFTYGEVKILPGNVGYVEIKAFNSTSYDKSRNKGRIKIQEVMRFLRNSNSLIIDLRNNQGGDIRQVAKFCSYFSPTPKNYFITSEWHSRFDVDNTRQEISSTNNILTSKYVDNALTRLKPVYVLTSQWTFSAAELAVYKLKQYNPSTIIVGENTSGGGNGHSGGYDNQYFFAVIPEYKFFDESNSNFSWEAKGIKADILISADSAFLVAYNLAAKGKELTDANTIYFKKSNDILVVEDLDVKKFYSSYVGDYRKIKIVRDGDKLFMIYDIYYKTLLLPVGKDLFMGENVQYVSFLRNSSGLVNEIRIKHTSEFLECFKKQTIPAFSTLTQ